AIDGEIHLTTAFRPGVRLSLPGSKTRASLPLEFCVKDNGPGIPEDLMPHLFDPFVTTKPSGSGLGLALVAKIIGDHGGIVECESQPRHTVFRVLMPMFTPARPGFPRADPHFPPRRQRRRELKRIPCPRETFWSPTTTPRLGPYSTRRSRAPATRCAPPATPRPCGAG